MKAKKMKLTTCPECVGTRLKDQDYVTMVACPFCAIACAAEFSRVLCIWLPSDQIAEAVRLNAAESPDFGICHSHDHCDANMAMYEAMTNLGIAPYIDYEDGTAERDNHLALWNAAWDIAKAAGFSPVVCTAEVVHG